MTDHIEKPPEMAGSRWRRHLHELLRLAWPVVLSRSGILFMSLVDTIMVARFSTQELAYQGIGLAPVGTLVVTAIGLIMGTLVLTSQELGAGRPRNCGAAWRHSLPYAFGLGLAAAFLCFLGQPFLEWSGQGADLSRGGGKVILVAGLGLPPLLLFIATSYFLEGIRRPLPGLVAMIFANLVNIFLNWILVYGHFGAPALGAVGSAWATTIVRTGMAVGLIIYVWNMADHTTFGVRLRPPGGWRSWAYQRRIGYASGMSSAVEAAAFTALTLMAGLLGPLAIASFSITLNLISIIFMTAVGLGTATAVRVGIAWGRGDRRDTDLAGWVGLALNSAIMVGFALLFFGFPALLARAYTVDPVLLGMTIPLIAFSAFLLVVDGGQQVMASALRGRGDTWIPTGLHVISYLVVMLPLSWFLAIVQGHGAMGLVEAILIASVVSVTLLTARFHHLSKPPQPAER